MAEYAPEFTDAEFAEQSARADKLVDKIVGKIPAQCATGKVDQGFVIFAMWVTMTQMLAADGWLVEELIKDVQHHHAIGSSEGVG